MTKTIQLLRFDLDDRSWGVPLAQVMRVIRAADYTPLPHAPGIVMGVIDLHGQVIPLLNIRRRFGLPEREIDLNDQFVIATAGGRPVALSVDAVKGVVECETSRIVAAGSVLPRLDQVEGLIQLEDGLTLIHDLDKFFSIDELRKLADALTHVCGSAL